MNNVGQAPLSDVLKTVGIDKVVWIDDDFAQADPDRQRSRIQTLIAKVHAQKVNPQHPLIAHIAHSLPEGVRATKIEQALTDKEDRFVQIIESLIQQCPDERQEGLEVDGELTPVQIMALRSALQNVETMSHKKWTANKLALLPLCSEKTLFLIDRHFTKEGLEDEGDEIVKELKGRGEYHCIMLTRIRPGEGTELLRSQIVSESNGALKLSDFSVMCKSQIGRTAEDAEREFCQALRVVFTHRHCHRVANKIGETMKGSINSTIDQLVNHSVYDIDQAIYANSLEEGASEFDVIARILLLEQRVASQKLSLSDRELIPQLGQLRSLRAMTPLAKSTTDEKSLKMLHKWKREEVFDEGEVVNKNFSSLSCGDVFQIRDSKKRFVLLVQPCEVAIRGESGERKAKEGIFVRICEKRPKPRKKEQNDSGRFYELEHIDGDGGSWLLDFLESSCVSLNVLELATFNSEGNVEINKDQRGQEFWMPGWKHRFQDSLNSIRAADPSKNAIPKRFAALSLNENLAGREGYWFADKKAWGFRFQRIGRIRPPYCEAILGSFAAYHTRAAFDHDFAKGLWPEPSDKTSTEIYAADQKPESPHENSEQSRTASVKGQTRM
jgi:hypothetical protein